MSKRSSVPSLIAASTTGILLVGGILAAPFASLGTRPVVAAGPVAPPAPLYVPDEVIVQFKADATPVDRFEAFFEAGVSDKEHIFTEAMRAAGDPGLVLASTPGSVERAIQVLENHPAVAFAEPNYAVRHQATSNDPYYTDGSLWGMHGDGTNPANQYGSQAGEAWANGHTGSKDVYVGVIDEGIDFNHPDLAANIWTNPNDLADGVDNDGNGYVDDVHGWDFATNDNTIYDGAPGDNSTDAHGTHVSGTIGAVGGNGKGVAGVNWNVTIISGKFLTPSGGNIANAIKAVDYFTGLKARGLNIVATNNSWGGGGYSVSLHAAINRAAKQNILFIAAAGNGNIFGQAINNDSSPQYPAGYNTTQAAGSETAAAYDAVIAVTAISSSGAKASWANYGKTTVDIGAPGVGIWSTTPNSTLSQYDGTSMATPHVAGAAALYASTHAGATALTIKNAILDAGVPTSSLNRKTVTGDRLNISDF